MLVPDTHRRAFPDGTGQRILVTGLLAVFGFAVLLQPFTNQIPIWVFGFTELTDFMSTCAYVVQAAVALTVWWIAVLVGSGRSVNEAVADVIDTFAEIWNRSRAAVNPRREAYVYFWMFAKTFRRSAWTKDEILGRVDDDGDDDEPGERRDPTPDEPQDPAGPDIEHAKQLVEEIQEFLREQEDKTKREASPR